MSKRKAFLEATSKEKVEDFLCFIQLHKDKAEPFDVEEVVQEMPREQREALWRQLESLLREILLELPSDQWEEEERMQQESVPDAKHVMAVVDGVVLVVAASLRVLQDGDSYSTLLDIAHRLHNVLVSLPVSEAALQLHIQKLFEAWWKLGLVEREKFGRVAFLFSLQNSFLLKKPSAEIERVWSLHDVLASLDYTSEDNKQIVDLLLQCFHRPTHIRNDDGKRFLVSLFNWDVDFIWVIHGTIKNQLEFYDKGVVDHIAEIYFRAWKKATGDFLETIESACIQDLMQNAILLQRKSPVHSKVRQILSYFHSRKTSHGVDKMLYNLYRPILWKSLSVPNFEVRANATLLFSEAFPVHDPEENSKTMDLNVQKQLDTMMGLFDDPQPTVRANATLGVCKILSKFWELLPPTIITDFLKKLVMELAADSSSPDVRCSVFMSLTIVLDNPLSHPLLEKLLPTLKNSLHDTSEKVRAAFLDLLIKVKAVRAAKFWDICSMEHLLARLAIDSQTVSKRIVNLLFKSFFPVDESEKEWCCRCVTLIQMNPMAARKFYQFAHKHTATTNIVKLMLAIRRTLNSFIQVDFDMTEINESNKENSTQAGPVLLGQDMSVVSSLLEVVAILWRSVEKALKQNEEAHKYTVAKFGNVMTKYFKAFEDERCTAPLIQLASFMPPAAVPTFSCGVLSRLRRMNSGATSALFSQLLDCVCSWGQVADILELVSDWLSESIPKQTEKATKSRKVQIQETLEAKPDLALVYLEYLFSHTSTREKVLALGEGRLRQLHTVLGNWKSVLYTYLSSSTEGPNSPTVQTALKAFIYHGRLSVHLQHSLAEGRDYLMSLEKTAVWISDKVLPFLTKQRSDDGKDSGKSQQLASKITESFLTLCCDIFLVGLGDEIFKGEMLHMCSLILNSESGYRCIPAILPILKEVANSFVPCDNIRDQNSHDESNLVMLGVVANLFHKIIALLTSCLKKDPEEGQLLCQSAVPSLTDFFQVAQTWQPALLSEVYSTVFAAIIVENIRILQKLALPEEVFVPQSVDEMPPLSNLLLSVIIISPSITSSFLAEVSSSLDSDALSSFTELVAVLHVLAVVKQKGHNKGALKSAAISIQRRLHEHAVSSLDSRELHRCMYESSVKTLNDLLHF